MTKSRDHLASHWVVRLAIAHGGMIHTASWTKPKVSITPEGKITLVEADWIQHSDYGDVIHFIDWTQLTAVTSRYHAAKED